MASFSELIRETLFSYDLFSPCLRAENLTEHTSSKDTQMVRVRKLKPKQCGEYPAKCPFQVCKTF